MIFKRRRFFVVILSAISGLLSISANAASCANFGLFAQGSNAGLINSETLVVYASKSQVNSKNFGNRSEASGAKILLRREFIKYFQNRENWHQLEINSSGGTYGTLRCGGELYYFFEINLKNIEITRLPALDPGDADDSELKPTDNIETTDNQFIEFK